MNRRLKFAVCATFLAMSAGAAHAASPDQTIVMNAVSDAGVGASLGRVMVEETPYGLVFTPSLTGLEPGAHGFHLHEKGSCAPETKDGKATAALAAGGHYDPDNTKKHGAPWGSGHRGDLPAMVVDAKGSASLPVLAPRLKMAELKGKALMIHAGGDNHADHPAPLGGGGARMACGVFR